MTPIHRRTHQNTNNTFSYCSWVSVAESVLLFFSVPLFRSTQCSSDSGSLRLQICRLYHTDGSEYQNNHRINDSHVKYSLWDHLKERGVMIHGALNIIEILKCMLNRKEYGRGEWQEYGEGINQSVSKSNTRTVHFRSICLMRSSRRLEQKRNKFSFSPMYHLLSPFQQLLFLLVFLA